MRAAALLATIRPRVPLDGSGSVVEGYPAAALRRWGLSWRQYKGSDHAEERRALMEAFAAQTGNWLGLSHQDRTRCEDSDDAFDALIASCAARHRQSKWSSPSPRRTLMRVAVRAGSPCRAKRR
jgi:hypothetical protein